MVFCLHFHLQYNKQHIIPLEDIKLQSLDDEGSKFICQQHLSLVPRMSLAWIFHEVSPV